MVAILERVFREQWGQVLAALIGFLGDFDLAEEAAQEAFAVAAERWIRLLRPEPMRCSVPVRIAPRSGELLLETGDRDTDALRLVKPR